MNTRSSGQRPRPAPLAWMIVLALAMPAQTQAQTPSPDDETPWMADAIVVTAVAPSGPLTICTDPKQPRQPMPASDGSMVGACPARMDNALNSTGVVGLAKQADGQAAGGLGSPLPHLLYGLLAFAFLARVLTLGLYPLTDNTEARYAEIARKMVETGHWLMPQIDYGVLFWGKPPLSMWLTAISYELLGVYAFAARLPSLLLGLAVCFLAYRLGAQYRGRDYGLRASIVVATSLLMLVSAGAVMTDPAMLLGTTLSMAGYWLAMTTSSRRWGYLFFVGLAIGLLAKGPVATVLTLLPVGAWALLSGRVAESGRRLPWVGGCVLLVVLVLPWYWAAERQSQGFLHYLIG